MEHPLVLFGETYHHSNILWATRFLAPDPVILVDADDHRTLWVSPLEFGRATKQARGCTVRSTQEIGGNDLMSIAGGEQEMWSLLLQRVLAEHEITTFGVDETFPAVLADALRGMGLTLVPALAPYRDARRIKTPEEITALAASEAHGVTALRAAYDLLASCTVREGMLWNEGRPLQGSDIGKVVEHTLLDLDCSTIDSITCGGPESADPHCTTSRVIRTGLPIVLDLYPFHRATRYWGDLTRTVVAGSPHPAAAAMWDAVREAQTEAVAMVRPGINGREIHRRCCEVFRDRGYGSLPAAFSGIPSTARFIHGTGHGVGLDIHEYPRIADVDVILEVGDVITIEPGLYDPQVGGVRIEDLVVVTASGATNLTDAEKIFELDHLR